LPDLGKLSPSLRCAAKELPVHPSRKYRRFVYRVISQDSGRLEVR
jgi:hypothetical protein